MNWYEREDLYGFDCEVFKYDFIVVFKNKQNGKRFIFHNDSEGLSNFIDNAPLIYGFNCKHYDNYILKAIVNEFTPQEVKNLNDYIIVDDGNGWEYPELQNASKYVYLNSFDLKDDMLPSLSLKSIEAHTYRNIKETEVDFNLNRPLSQEELNLVIKYCCEDVDATEALFDLRFDYLDTKVYLGSMIGLSADQSLSMSNAKVTAKYLNATFIERNDGRELVLPKGLIDQSNLPNGLYDFFQQINDLSIPDDVLFKKNFKTIIAGCPCVFSWGGGHGTKVCYHTIATELKIIEDRDGESLYPNMLIIYNYLSRNIANPKVYSDTLTTRLDAKHKGNIKISNTLKLPLNVVTGASDAKYNDLYDPRNTRSMRICSQLIFAELMTLIAKNVKSFQLINYNTDGFMYEANKSDLPEINRICNIWENKTKINLKTDGYKEVFIKATNDYLAIDLKDNVSYHGKYLSRGISEKGAWSINNALLVIKYAIQAYLVDKTPVEETINNNNNIFDYQMIANVSSKYLYGYHVVDGEEVRTQKVNRIYATSNHKYGGIYKVKEGKDHGDHISEMPEHCLIDNDNNATIEDIDKSWYIKLAKQKLRDYLVSKPNQRLQIKSETLLKKEGTKNMPKKSDETTEVTTKSEDYTKIASGNIYQKLAFAKNQILQTKMEMSGVNSHVGYEYFQLKDFLPSVTKIFNDVGLIGNTSFPEGLAVLDIINTTSADIRDPEKLRYVMPMPINDPILNKQGKAVVNDVQNLGMSITYMRRYLWITALDLVESDGIEALADQDIKGKVDITKLKKLEAKQPVDKAPVNTDTIANKNIVEAPTTPTRAAPLNQLEKKAIIEKNVGSVEKLSKVDIDNVSTLKSELKKVLALRTDESSQFVQQIVLDTNHFTENIAKDDLIKYQADITRFLSEGVN